MTERSRQRQKVEKRNVLKDIPQDITRHVNKFLGPEDHLSEVNMYFNETVDPNHCIRETNYGLACLKNMTNLYIGSQCYNMCTRHFKKIVAEWFNMVTRDIKIVDQDGSKILATFSSMTAIDESKNPVWSTSFTHDMYFGRELVVSDYRTNMQFGTRGRELGTYLSLNKWMIPFENLHFRAMYNNANFDNIAEVFGTWKNGINVMLNPTNFQMDTLRANRLIFEFDIENIVNELEEEEEEEEEKLENDIKEIDCEHLTRDSLTCTNNLFEEVTSQCDSYCKESFLDGIINLIYLITSNPLYVDVLHQGSLTAYQLSRNWNMILLDQEDILFESNSEEENWVDIFNFLEKSNWSKILIGFPKSENHLGVVTKMYVKILEDVIRLKGFMEDESHVILIITNRSNTIMEEPD